MKEVKGFVTYVYKGVQYFEKPHNTYISKIEYNEADNMSTVYLKRNRVITEILCIMILCFMIYFVYNSGDYIQVIHMPSSAYYYWGKLYVNMVADESNKYPVSYNIAGYSGVLNPGESLECIDYTYTNQMCETITYTVKIFGIDKTFSKDIPVGKFSIDDGGVEYERY